MAVFANDLFKKFGQSGFKKKIDSTLKGTPQTFGGDFAGSAERLGDLRNRIAANAPKSTGTKLPGSQFLKPTQVNRGDPRLRDAANAQRMAILSGKGGEQFEAFDSGEREALGKRFDIAEKRAVQRATASQQGQTEALRRRLAAGPGLSSGAALKLQEQQGGQQQQQLQDVREGIEGQRLGAEEKLSTIEAQRNFARQERIGGQQFQALQQEIGRQAAVEEAAKLREFQAMDASNQRGFSRELFDIQQGFKDKAFDFQQTQAAQQFQVVMAQLGLDIDNTEFNRLMATATFNKPDLLEQIIPVAGIAGGKGAGVHGTLARDFGTV